MTPKQIGAAVRKANRDQQTELLKNQPSTPKIMTSEYVLIPATDEHHGVSISFTSQDRARLVRVMRSGRDNGTIGMLTRNYGSLPPDRNRTWNHGRACPVPFEEMKAAIDAQAAQIEAKWSTVYSA